MAEFVWVTRLDGFGQNAVDLHQCRRHPLFVPSGDGDQYDHRVYYYHYSSDTWILEYIEYYSEFQEEDHRYEDAVVVAYEMLKHSRKLPPELEPHREIASDHHRFMEWSKQRNGQPVVSPPPKPRPQWSEDDKTLYLGCVICKKFRGKSKNQFAILDAFEQAMWPAKPIRIPSLSEAQLREAIKILNKSQRPRVLIKFSSEGRNASWSETPTVRPNLP